MNKRIALCAAILAVTGCTVTKDWVPTGGSRSDGIIRVSYEIGEFETAKTDAAQGRRVAAERCQVWGYDDAEPFGGQTRTCSVTSGFSGCATWLVTMEYQCLGNLQE